MPVDSSQDSGVSAPIIVTACVDDVAQQRLDDLRARCFPPGRTVIGAHLTLFHAVPATYRDTLVHTVEGLCAEQAPFEIALPSLYSLGRGFAIRVKSPQLTSLRGRMAAPLRAGLTAQDAQGFRPHITLANKMEPGDARAMLADMQLWWSPMHAVVQALTLWRYLGPQWRLDARMDLAGPPEGRERP